VSTQRETSKCSSHLFGWKATDTFLGSKYNSLKYSMLLQLHSGVTRVGVTQGGNWLCNSYVLILVITVCQFYSVTTIFSSKTWRPFLLIAVTFLFHSGATPSPSRVSPRAFLPVRPPLSTVLWNSVTSFFFIRVCQLGRSAPSDATAFAAGTRSPGPPRGRGRYRNSTWGLQLRGGEER